jgi:hypothetical protein
MRSTDGINVRTIHLEFVREIAEFFIVQSVKEKIQVNLQQYHTIPSFFPPILQSTKMAKKQTKAGRIQKAKNKKKVQDALHDAVATDDDVESPCPLDKEPEPDQPKALPSTQEMAPDRLDAITDMDRENNETSTNVGSGVAIDDNLPFAIADTKTEEMVDTDNVLNVGPIVNPHINDGDESTVPDVATDDDGLSNEDIPCKKPSRPMVSEPQVPKPTTRK